MRRTPIMVLAVIALGGLAAACSEAPGSEWAEGTVSSPPASNSPAASGYAGQTGAGVTADANANAANTGTTVAAAGPTAVPPTPAAAPPPAPPPGPPPSPRQAFESECGACHMPFPPQFLPVRSWKALMSGLTDHFGEDASLDAETTKAILQYVTANAADAGGRSPGILRGLKPGAVPLRITSLPWWQWQHSEISPRRFARADIKTKSNCLACHRNGGSAEEGE